MAAVSGYIALHRKILEWEWFKDAVTFRTFIYLLLSANYEPGEFQGVRIERGQLVTSLPKLSAELQQTIQQTRTAIKHLQLTGEITDKSNPHYRIITIVKYDQYQQANRQNNRQLTDNQQTDQQTDQQQYNKYNNINNNKRINNNSPSESNTHKDDNNNQSIGTPKKFVKPTKEEVKRYCWFVRKNDVDFEKFYAFYEANGWKVGRNPMKDWKATVRYWERNNKGG